MKKALLTIVIIVLVIVFIASAAAGTLLTIRTVGWSDLADVSRITDWAGQIQYNVSDLTNFFSRRGTRTYEIDQTKSITYDQLAKIEEIHVTSLSEQVKLTTNESDVQARISGSYSSTSELIWEVEVINNILNIRTRYPKFGFRSQNLKIDVVIPADFNGKVYLNTLSGNCSLPDKADYKWQGFYYDGLSAELKIEQANMQTLNLKTLSGNIEANNINSSLIASSMSGNLSLNFTEANNASVDTMSGKVTITSPKDNLIKLNFKTLSGDLDLNSNQFDLSSQKDRLTSGILFGGEDSGKIWSIETMSGNLIIR